MFAMRAFRRRLGAIGLAAISIASAGLLATACGTTSSGPGAARTVAVTPPPATKTVTASPSTGPSGLGQCTAGDLRLTVGRENGAAGTIYYPLEFTNVSSSACTMYGYPGMAFVTSPGGSIIGPPAGRR